MQFKLTAFYALGVFEIFKVGNPLQVCCSNLVSLINSLAKHAYEKTSNACFA